MNIDFTLLDDDLDAMPLLEGALTINRLIKPSIDTSEVTKVLDNMLIEIKPILAKIDGNKAKFDALLHHFYHQWGFKGDDEHFFSSDNIFVHSVLKRRIGIPVTLGTVLLYLSEKLDLPVSGVLFPSQFILKVKWGNEASQFINPFDGKYIPMSLLHAWLIGHDGPYAKIKPCHLEKVDNAEILGRWLSIMKSMFLHEKQFMLALRCTDVALNFAPEDPYEIRDRGFIYQQLECNHMALDDYRYFIDQCPEDPAADVLKLQIRAMDQRAVTIH